MSRTVVDKIADALAAIVGEEQVHCGESMALHTTFCIGGLADWYVVPRSEEQVRAVMGACRALDVPMRVLGCGSNVLVADEGLRCVVVQLADNLADVSVEGRVLQAQAGATCASVAAVACEAGLAGFEFACGIPGTIGGAAIMNAGAYGGEFRDVAESVRCLTPAGKVVQVDAEEANWSYRHSMMDEAGYIVLCATLRLTPESSQAVRERMDDFTQRREEKQPLAMPSAGSTFKRPEGHFVGKLVQDAGLRGYKIGGAQVSEKHTGFVVNAGGATASDVCQLIEEVRARVYAQAGVRLQPEVRMWGFDKEARDELPYQ